MAPTETPAPRYTTVTVPADHRVMISAQTASRDYIATVVPGVYPVTYTDVNYHPVREGERPYFVMIRVQIDTPERRESTVEFGGVALASRTVEAERMNHTIVDYAYRIKDGVMDGLTFA